MNVPASKIVLNKVFNFLILREYYNFFITLLNETGMTLSLKAKNQLLHEYYDGYLFNQERERRP